MKILKTTVTFVLVLSLTFAFAACSAAPHKPIASNDAPTVNALAKSKDASGAKKYIYVGFVQVGAESDWRMANTQSMQETFTADKGYKFEMVDCQQQTPKQITAIRDFIQKGVDYIVLAPNTEAGWETVLGEAKEAGIPVIIVDRQIKTSDESLYAAWVGSDFFKEGRDAAAALEKILQKKGIKDTDTVNIVTLQGTMGSSAQLGRTEGFKQGMAEHPNWRMLAKESGDFTQEKGQEVMESFLKSYNNINAVISENDNMSFGAINAIKTAGKTCGPTGDISLVSFDGCKAAFQVMVEGNLDVDIECNPLHGPRVEAIIKALEAKQTVEKKSYVTEETFWPDNAKELMSTRF